MSQWNDNNGVGQFTFAERSVGSRIEIRPLMRLVYIWMMFGLLTTGIISFALSSWIGTNPAQNFQTINVLVLPIFIAQIGIVIGISWGMNRLAPAVAGFLFFVYSALMGVTLGVLFFAYIAAGQSMAIAQAFFTTAGLFGVMTVVGYTTKVDLTKYSTYFGMALIGLVIAMVVNFFLGSGMLELIISVVGVILFTALTAYDTQKIKNLSMQPEMQNHSDSMARLAIFGALTLYLDFINLFLFLLRIFGGGGRD